MTGVAETRTERRLLDGGLLLIALGALALAISLFVDWYGADFGFDGGKITAWTAFELVDIVLATTALAALITVGERLLAPGPTQRLPTWVSVVCGPIALVIVVVSLIDEPPAAGAAATIEAGGWIALAGAGLMTFGALLSRLRISIVVGAREQRSGVDRDAETRPLRTEGTASPVDPDRPL
jgi:hypothetical protein